MIRVMRKPGFCICENKGANQLCGNIAASPLYADSIRAAVGNCQKNVHEILIKY